MDYVCVERKKTPPVSTGDPAHRFTAAGKKIKAWRLPDPKKVQEGEDEPNPQQEAPKQQRVYTHREAKQYTEVQIRDTKYSKYEAELTGLHNGLSKSGYLKDLEKVHIKFGRLKQKHKDVSHLYEVFITDKPGPRKGQRYAASLIFTRKATHEQKCRASGGYVIRTTHLDWSVEQVARMYW